MNTLLALTETLRTQPDDTTRLVLSDYLGEHGTEEDWQSLLDQFPEDFLLRERFGHWLLDRGEERGKGYLVLATRWIDFKPKRFPGRQTPYNQITSTNNHHGYLPSIEPDWLARVPKAADHWCYNNENDFWRIGLTRRDLEDRVAVGFTKLPLARQEELLKSRV